MRIQHNIPALNTYRQMGVNNSGTAKALEKLSSGYKINRAGDDAAGLAISEKMRAQVRGLNRASANAQDGISLIQAAEGALQETHSILQRMRELSVQAASDVNELEDRNAIADEINQLQTEIDRVAHTTEFNKKTVLDGSLKLGEFGTKMLSGTAVLAGAHVDAAVSSELVQNEAEGSTSRVSGIFTIAVDTVGVQAKYSFDYNLQGLNAGDSVKTQLSIDNEGNIRGGGQTIESDVFTYTAVGDAAIDNAAFINGLKEALQKVVEDYDISSSGTTITFTAKDIGSGYGEVALATEAPDGASNTGDALKVDEGVTAVEGQDAIVSIKGKTDSGEEIDTTIETNDEDGKYNNGLFKADQEGLGFVFKMADLKHVGSSILQVVAGKNLTIQAGANTGKDQTIDIAIGEMSASGLGVDNLDVSTHIASQATLASVNNAITLVSTQRAALGAVQNRLEHTISNLDTVSENLQDAESRIRDVDMAKEMMNFTKFNILTQASQAMMAQANNLPQGVLQLLR